jgi:hypothetical protein
MIEGALISDVLFQEPEEGNLHQQPNFGKVA